MEASIMADTVHGQRGGSSGGSQSLLKTISNFDQVINLLFDSTEGLLSCEW